MSARASTRTPLLPISANDIADRRKRQDLIMRMRRASMRIYRRLPPVVWVILACVASLALFLTYSSSGTPPDGVAVENSRVLTEEEHIVGDDDHVSPDIISVEDVEEPGVVDDNVPDEDTNDALHDGAGAGIGDDVELDEEEQEGVKHGKSTPEPTKRQGITDNEQARARKDAVRDAMGHAWRGYSDKCFGRDEFNPVKNSCKDWMGMGLTLIDSLDTLYIMGYQDEFDKCRDWISEHLRLDHDRKVSFFETTIRVLGGLLSAYDLSKDELFLEKAADVGARLGQAFNTASGMPNANVHLRSGQSSAQSWAGTSLLLAEVGTVQLEFKYLSQHINNDTWAKKADKVVDMLDLMVKPHEGMYPYKISQSVPPKFTNQVVTYGAMGDSWFEYLLKLWIQTGKKNDQYKRMYLESTRGLFEHLYMKHEFSGLYYIAEMTGSSFNHKMDHLACFASGMLALGYQSGILDDETEETRQQHLTAGGELARTCHQMSQKWPSKLAPEYVKFPEGADMQYARDANFYILRPEASEAMFYMWRVTKDQIYRDMAWDIFQGIEKNAKQEHGYASMRNVERENPVADPNGIMQSFMLAETLKYQYLIFCEDDVISLDDYVFNTEAHPLSVFEKPSS